MGGPAREVRVLVVAKWWDAAGASVVLARAGGWTGGHEMILCLLLAVGPVAITYRWTAAEEERVRVVVLRPHLTWGVLWGCANVW